MNSYKEMAEQLESIIVELQDGNLDIDKALEEFNNATKLIKKMENYLAGAENKINKIKSSLG